MAAHGAEACDYLLGVDVDMATVEGYELTSWERGYGDFRLCPDLDTLRLVPWHEATALVLCDVLGHDGTPVAPSPRQVLRRQIERLAERGLAADVGTELEFVVYRDTYEEAWTTRLPRPHARQPLQRRLLAPRHAPGSSPCCAASATR